MSFVTFAERFGFEEGEKKGFKKGLAQGRWEAIRVAIELRFPEAPPSLMQRVWLINDVVRLKLLLQAARAAPLADIETAITAALAFPPA